MLLEKAPDVEATLDEQTGLWTVVLSPPTRLDAGCVPEKPARGARWMNDAPDVTASRRADALLPRLFAGFLFPVVPSAERYCVDEPENCRPAGVGLL